VNCAGLGPEPVGEVDEFPIEEALETVDEPPSSSKFAQVNLVVLAK